MDGRLPGMGGVAGLVMGFVSCWVWHSWSGWTRVDHELRRGQLRSLGSIESCQYDTCSWFTSEPRVTAFLPNTHADTHADTHTDLHT